MALAADEAGFAGLALMDHLIQIPQVDRAWEPIPEPWVTLGLVAGLDTGLRLGTLVTPVTFRPPGITAKAAATLDALTGGRAFVGVGAGWWDREHAAYGLPFPPARERLDALEAAIETMRALWAPGTKAYAGERVALPETTCYPRPAGRIPVIVGGNGERRTLRDRRPARRRLQPPVGRRGARPQAGGAAGAPRRDRAAVRRPRGHRARPACRRSRPRRRLGAGRAAAGPHRRRGVRTPKHAGTVAQHRDRWAGLAERGVGTVFVTTPDLDGPDDVLDLAGLNA